MTILKQHASADGYECRLVRHPGKSFVEWEVLYNGEWLSLRQLGERLPFSPSSSALQHRVINAKNVTVDPLRTLAASKISLWGRNETPSRWAKGWAERKGIPDSKPLRSAFIRFLAAELEKDHSRPNEALVRTLKNFTWVRGEMAASGQVDVGLSRASN